MSFLKIFEKWAGVVHDQSHAIQNPRVNALDDLVFHVIVGHVPPPAEDIGLGENGFGQTMFGFIEGGGADLEVRLAPENPRR